MAKQVTLRIDGKQVTVPEGTLVVNAAKMNGIDIPVFCYHPKMEPVGMCRMCLVEVGRPVIDRATNQPVLEADGSLKIGFAPKLETACTLPVAEGMVILTESEKARTAHKEVVEMLLTSHPLDCPVCDKGGECPLQNLTMAHGPGQSRFIFDDKSHAGKHVPLGDLIFVDRERCIQCARCVRFQKEVVDDPVIGFYQRGRSLEIVTHSDPGFDSVFSGNTTDICPVGALTTADFRFGARPWEMNQAASICNHCAVGCNLTFNVRREAKSGGRTVIKRVMPRQNESVNEIWMCDKGRFAYHFAESDQRLLQPLVRKNGELTPVDWDEALNLVAEKLRDASLVTLAGGRLSNEDLFNLRKLTDALDGQAVLYSDMAGGDLVSQFGMAPGSNLGDLGKGSLILVAACDLHEEAPVWWLRVKQAAQRGAKLIVLGGRPTRLDAYASQIIRYAYGAEAETLQAMLPGVTTSGELSQAAQTIATAENVVIFYGSEGLGLAGSEALAHAAAELLLKTDHISRANNGLIAVWPHANTQGACEMGFRPLVDLAERLVSADAVIIAAADPAGDSIILADALDKAGFVVLQELFLTETARHADVVLPVQAFTEREGTYTSGERRVQRYYPAAVPPLPGPRADFSITAQIAQRMNITLEARAAALLLLDIAKSFPAYAGLTYQKLAETHEQWPAIGRADVYYGGTTYDNHQGLGVQLVLAARGELPLRPVAPKQNLPENVLRIVPITRLFDRGTLLLYSPLLKEHLAPAALWINSNLAIRHGLVEGGRVTVDIGGRTCEFKVRLDDSLPAEAAFLPRSLVCKTSLDMGE